MARAATSGADEMVFDLEDSVRPERKTQAREALCWALSTWDGPRVAVRVNAPGTPWCHLDIAALAAVSEAPVSIVLPKVEHPGDVEFAYRLLAGAEAATGRRTPIGLQALVETAAGLAQAERIAAASTRTEAMVLGYADLAASLRRRTDSWQYAQDTVLIAARAHGLQAIDGPHLGIADDDSFRAAARHARELGFDGKWAIHPGQIAALNEVFSFGVDEIARNRAVIAALDNAGGAGAVAFEGQMVDEAVAVAARQVVASAGEHAR